eukprot:TRINITY_DN27718_c0_g1_i1.p1 TRINITY_DN27718_c0_g1~~TRINITY_DN27718_c0_g1_i1.p1  ORF type:complete len:666 (+),score=196.72 TRINITY_DN27718_c0_g1_i1:100-2097(+)
MAFDVGLVFVACAVMVQAAYAALSLLAARSSRAAAAAGTCVLSVAGLWAMNAVAVAALRVGAGVDVRLTWDTGVASAAAVLAPCAVAVLLADVWLPDAEDGGHKAPSRMHAVPPALLVAGGLCGGQHVTVGMMTAHGTEFDAGSVAGACLLALCAGAVLVGSVYLAPAHGVFRRLPLIPAAAFAACACGSSFLLLSGAQLRAPTGAVLPGRNAFTPAAVYVAAASGVVATSAASHFHSASQSALRAAAARTEAMVDAVRSGKFLVEGHAAAAGGKARDPAMRRVDAACDGLGGELAKITRYMPRTVMLDLLQDGTVGRSSMEVRDLTLLFVDIKNFTTMCERIPVGTLVDLMTQYFNSATLCLTQHGCTLDKFIGDAVMGFWGAPLVYPRPAFSACCTALHLLRICEELSDAFESTADHPLRIRAGINSGDAAVGSIGGDERLTYTALGDVVNTASRLEGLNKEYGSQVIVSEDTRWRLEEEEGFKEHFVLCLLGTAAVRGKRESRRVFQLCGRRTETQQPVLPTPFIHNDPDGVVHVPLSPRLRAQAREKYSVSSSLGQLPTKAAELSLLEELDTAPRSHRFRPDVASAADDVSEIYRRCLEGDVGAVDAAQALATFLSVEENRAACTALGIHVDRLDRDAKAWRGRMPSLLIEDVDEAPGGGM